MDPTQCYAELLAARAAGDAETAIERASDLRDWLQKEGFPPEQTTPDAVQQVLTEVLGSKTAGEGR